MIKAENTIIRIEGNTRDILMEAMLILISLHKEGLAEAVVDGYRDAIETHPEWLEIDPVIYQRWEEQL